RDKKFKSELRYNGNRSKPGIPGEMGIQSTARTPLLPYQDITNHVLSSRSTVFFGTSSLDVNIGLLYNDRKEFEEAHHHEDLEEGHHHDDDGLHPALQMKLKTLNYDLKYHLPKMGKFETIVGMQGMDQTNTNKGEER